MKKLPRVTSLAIIGTILLGTVGSAFAAWQPIMTGDCSAEDTDIYAQDGDVVTVAKWNSAMCTIRGIYIALADYGRKETPFVWGSVPRSTI